MITRRTLLKAGGLTLVSAGFGGTLFPVRAQHAPLSSVRQRRRKVLLSIFLRGGMDGLMAVTPFTDPMLVKLRPKLLLPPPDSAAERAMLRLDDTFALHPSLAPLLPFYNDGRLAIVHGVGSPDTTRSHFDAQEYMESGTPGNKGTRSGWLNRALALLESDEKAPFRAVAATPALPRALYGEQTALVIPHLQTFGLQVPGAKPVVEGARSGFESLYQHTSDALLKGTGAESFVATKMLAELDPTSYRPEHGAEYPLNSVLGDSLRQIAQLVKADLGLEIAFAESTDWDTHTNQHASLGSFSGRAADLAQSLAAFYTDLGNHQDDVTVITMTEFGRTVAQNGSSGTDHGRASCLFVLGPRIKGGQVYGTVPPLEPDALEDGRDLPVTTDFRAVFAEVAGKHLGITEDTPLFPGWQGQRLPLFTV